MRIVYASSEAVPFAKTGGLADVAGGVTQALASAGHEVTLITPFYNQVQKQLVPQGFVAAGAKQSFTISMADKPVTGHFYTMVDPQTKLNVILVECPEYYNRGSLYGDKNQAYPDNCERYCFFSRAVVEWIRLQPHACDVINSNDWQTGLIPALVKTQLRQDPRFANTATVLTIHNMNFQGTFWHWDMLLTGMDWSHFNWREMEYYGQINLLKTGIVFADKITTVSPTYAQEIQTQDFGCGLDNVLQHRTEDLVGILNGIDKKHWDPATDTYLAAQYTHANFLQGKKINKQELQRALGLPLVAERPVLGMVSRMTHQKGFDLLAQIADQLFQLPAQFVFLGAGDPYFEDQVNSWFRRYPDKVAGKIGYDERLAHLIEAGADFFLMPSQFEPCGLNQMYSMNYGTIPIVHAVGGLADSVVSISPITEQNKTATGFVFDSYDANMLLETCQRALDLYGRPARFHEIITNGMNRDFTWNASAAEYLKTYQSAQAMLHATRSSIS